MKKVAALLLLVVASSGCHPMRYTARPLIRSCAGPDMDIRHEPQYEFGLDQLVRWFRGGCPIRRDTLMTRREPSCPPTNILLAVPLGPVHPIETREYDHPSVLASVPAGALSTGYEQEGSELWMVPGDYSAIYVHTTDGKVERWAWDQHAPGCQ